MSLSLTHSISLDEAYVEPLFVYNNLVPAVDDNDEVTEILTGVQAIVILIKYIAYPVWFIFFCKIVAGLNNLSPV